MFERIETLRMARAMIDHSVQRQTVVARNIANADTPGYQAADVQSFADSYHSDTAPFAMRTTNARHLADPGWLNSAPRISTSADGASPNGNSVSIEDEMVKLAEVRHEQEIALGVYRSGLDMMRTSLGRRA